MELPDHASTNAPPAGSLAGALDKPLNARYVLVILVEAAVIVLLWLFGRMFS